MKLRTVSVGLLAVALLLGLGAPDVDAQPFTAIRIGDIDGIGYGAGAGYVAANGGPVNVDGLGVLADGDFIPDLNGDGVLATGSRDDFDNRSAAEIAGNYVEGVGFSNAGGSMGSQFTDIALSTSFDATFGTPNDFPTPPSTTRPNQPGFVFDFDVAGTDIVSGQGLFLNVIFGDYDVTPAQLRITRADNTSQVLSLTVQPAGQDGLMQAAFVNLAFADVFTANGSDWSGYVEVDFEAPNEPYTVFDYAEISTEPIVGGPLEIDCPEDVTVDCFGSTDPSATGTATATGGYPPLTITYVDVAVGYDIQRTWTVTDFQGNAEDCQQMIYVTQSLGHIVGTLSADCTTLGITVDIFDDEGYVVSAVTDANGYYYIHNLPSGETYLVSIVTPLGYIAMPNEATVTVGCEETVEVNFSLECPDNAGEQRTIGFWKHQFGVATGGKGHAHIDGPTLCNYLDLIEGHFNGNDFNEVAVYVPPAGATCDEKLMVGKELMNLKGNVGMTARAKQQLMALLLNVASGKLALTAVISADGATVSQAITYCDNLIDDPNGDHETAKTIADWINNGMEVPAGVIPLTTANIAYKSGASVPGDFMLSQNYPNPFNPTTRIEFVLSEAGHVSIDVYNIAGRKVGTIADQVFSAGRNTVEWDASNLASGVYFYQFHTDRVSITRKMVLMK